ncbi:eCIS core domain-containing protein [Deinococcus sp.]|uniref:eCIS core domain-containing protein n=1 Tax=Deinococcus sp. TaxID=47478 RepID=UPI003B5A71FA
MTEYMSRPKPREKEQDSAATYSRPAFDLPFTPTPLTPEQVQARDAKIAELKAQWEAAQPKPMPAAAQMTPERSPRPIAAQRQAVRPVFEAAKLSYADRAHTQQAGSELAVQRQALTESQAALKLNDLHPQPAHLLPRTAPRPEAPVPHLSPIQRQALTETAHNEISSALTAHARYLPPAQRADMASAAIQRFKAQGLDPEPLRAVMLQRAPDDNTREAAQNTLNAQRHTDIRQRQERTDHALLTNHAAVQRRFDDAQQQFAGTQADIMARIEARRGNGSPLSIEVRQQLEAGLNHDLSAVRVHTDEEADQLAKHLHATAFTSGKDIYFQSGQFDPTNKFDLLIHEATHVKQQDLGKVGPGLDPDTGLEDEAKANETALPKTATVKAAETVPATATQNTTAAPTAVQRKGAAPAAKEAALPKELVTHAMSDPKVLGTALTIGRLHYAFPPSQGLKPPLDVPAFQLRGLLNQAPAELLRGVRAYLDERSRGFNETLLAVFDAEFALSLQKRLGKPTLLSSNELSADAFVEQLTNRASYMNDTDLDSTNADRNEITGKQRSNFQGKNLLSYFGFESQIPVFGEWGFQMRVFTPLPVGKVSDKAVLARREALGLTVPIVVFRGTEGLQLNTTEGGQDTLVGDTAKASVGMLQYEMNEERIDAALKHIKLGIFAGHSLGGGLAQIVAATYVNKVERVVTFQSPGLPADLAQQFTKTNHSQAHHYRVAGDIVPLAGQTLLPGEINYFTRLAKGKTDPQFKAAVELAASHVAFPLTTLLQSQDPTALTPEQQAILKFGAHDRGETEMGSQARMLPTGTYTTEEDPRMVLEGTRSTKLAGLAEWMQLNDAMAEANIGYNVLLEAVEPKLRAATTYEQFKAVYEWLGTVEQLPISKKQEEFLGELGISDRAPRTLTYTVSDDPEHLMPKINIPIKDQTTLTYKQTFLGEIHKKGGMVDIAPSSIDKIRLNIHIHWAGQHNGRNDAIAWFSRLQVGK